MSDSFRPLGIQPARLLCQWDFSGKNTEWIAISYPRGSTQGVNPLLLCLLHRQADSLPLVPSEKLKFRNLNILKHVFHSSSLLLSFPNKSLYVDKCKRRVQETSNKIVSQSVSSVTQLCLTLCNAMNCSTPGLPVHHQLPEFTQTHVHRVGDAIQPSHPLSSPSPPAPNLSQYQSLFQ